MEGLGVTIFGDVYKNLCILIIGHTGFKGSWLALRLKYFGAKITGQSLTPDSTASHRDLLNLDIEWNVALSLEQLQDYEVASSQSGLKWIRK